MMFFDKPSKNTIFTLITLWAFFAGLVMFLVNFWVSDFIAAAGVLLGFLTLVLSEKFKAQNPFVRHIFAISSFLLIAFFSIGVLWFSCSTNIISNQFCSERPRVTLLMADVGFVGAPIIATYLFVHIPRLIFQKKL